MPLPVFFSTPASLPTLLLLLATMAWQVHAGDSLSGSRTPPKADSAKLRVAADSTISRTVRDTGIAAKPVRRDSATRADTMRSILVGLYDPTRPRQDSAGSGSIVRTTDDSARARGAFAVASKPAVVGHRAPAHGSGTVLVMLRLFALLASIAVIVATMVFLRRRSESRRFMTNTRLSIMDKEVQLACRHIEKFYKDPDLCPDTVCAALVTGRAFLETLFEKDLGMSLDEFIDQVRVNRARIIMDKNADADPAVVAVEAGYGTMDRFLPVFERITGTTFVDYLRAIDRTRAS